LTKSGNLAYYNRMSVVKISATQNFLTVLIFWRLAIGNFMSLNFTLKHLQYFGKLLKLRKYFCFYLSCLLTIVMIQINFIYNKKNFFIIMIRKYALDAMGQPVNFMSFKFSQKRKSHIKLSVQKVNFEIFSMGLLVWDLIIFLHTGWDLELKHYLTTLDNEWWIASQIELLFTKFLNLGIFYLLWCNLNMRNLKCNKVRSPGLFKVSYKGQIVSSAKE